MWRIEWLRSIAVQCAVHDVRKLLSSLLLLRDERLADASDLTPRSSAAPAARCSSLFCRATHQSIPSTQSALWSCIDSLASSRGHVVAAFGVAAAAPGRSVILAHLRGRFVRCGCCTRRIITFSVILFGCS